MKQKFIILLALVLLGIFGRIFPHPWNFTPIISIIIFSGFYLKKTKSLILIPLMVLVSDYFIGLYELELMFFVYLSYAIILLLSFTLEKRYSFNLSIYMSIGASILFFTITNFAVWYLSPWYPHNLSGLLECYYMALPFFRNSLMGNVFYTSVLFGVYEFAKSKTVIYNSIFKRVS